MIGSSIFDHSTEETREELRRLFAKWNETHATNISMHVQLMTKNGEAVDVMQTVHTQVYRLFRHKIVHNSAKLRLVVGGT